MTVWALALIAWLVVFPVVVVGLAYALSIWVRRPERMVGGLAEVIPLEPVRRRRERALQTRPARLRSDHTAPVA
jgi:hypothetical protein